MAKDVRLAGLPAQRRAEVMMTAPWKYEETPSQRKPTVMKQKP